MTWQKGHEPGLLRKPGQPLTQIPDPPKRRGRPPNPKPSEFGREGFDLDTLKREVFGELLIIFQNPQRRSEMPGSALVALAKELLKAPAEPAVAEEPEPLSVLRIVQDSTLAPQRKHQLLVAERKRLQTELGEIEKEIEHAEKERGSVVAAVGPQSESGAVAASGRAGGE